MRELSTDSFLTGTHLLGCMAKGGRQAKSLVFLD